jgi:hypothetical protein
MLAIMVVTLGGPAGMAENPAVAALVAGFALATFAFTCWWAYRRVRQEKVAAPTSPTLTGTAFPGVLNGGDYPHALRFRGWGLARQLFVCAMAGLFGAASALLPLLEGHHIYPQPPLIQAVAWLALLWCGYRLWQLRSPWLILYSDHLEKRGLTGWKLLSRADIDGLRSWSDRSGTWIELVPKTAGRGVFDRVVLSGSVRDDPVAKRWLNGLRDLDVVAKAAAKAEILNDPRFGETIGSREARLKLARVAALTFDGVCVAIGLWLYFWPPADIITLGLAVAAIAAGFALIQGSRGLLMWLDPTRVRPPVIGAVAPAVAMALLALSNFHFLNFGGVMILDALLTAASVAAFYFGANGPKAAGATVALDGLAAATPAPPTNPLRILPAVAVCAAFLFYGAIAFTNAALDTSKVQVYPLAVLGQYVSSGRSTTYYVSVGPWSDQPAGQVSVPRSLYGELTVGSSVCFYRQSGALRLSWFRAGMCPAGIQAAPLAP